MIAEILGFGSVDSALWNLAAYAAFIGIIIGVFNDKRRNILFTAGAAVLALYAGVFLGNPVFFALQLLVTISGVMQLKGLKKPIAVLGMTILTIDAYILLWANGAISDIWALTGSVGLLGIAFGLTAMPKKFGFLLMAFGGVMLVFYGFHVAAWVFFLLNIVFAAVSLKSYLK